MFSKKLSGILMHISSLPSDYGIGDLGPQAYRYVDFLSESGQTHWQILPLNPIDAVYGNSPYSSISAFAGNTLFISPELLIKDGIIDSKDLAASPNFPVEKVDYEAVRTFKEKLLDTAVRNFKAKKLLEQEYLSFCQEHAYWLEDFALFRAFKKHYNNRIWNQWPEGIRNRRKADLEKFSKQFSDELTTVKIRQFIFYRQWFQLRNYCQKKNIQLIGDIPIYVNYDSADAWSHQKLFKLDENLQMVFVAGVPPDYFSQTGQRWGNPVYDWEELKKTKYQWWVKRFDHNFKLFDIVRIDHFRGFVSFWEIPVQEETAVNGHWAGVPYEEFFNTLKGKFPSLPVIAEDLGIITDEVTQVMNRFGFPGMKVMLFAFGGDLKTHPYIPENFISNCVAYTGTHDNNTVMGWYQNEASDHEKNNLSAYLNRQIDPQQLPWQMVEVLMQSCAESVLIPLQDILGLGQECRMNVPSTVSGNWQWRVHPQRITADLAQKLYRLTQVTDRMNPALLKTAKT